MKNPLQNLWNANPLREINRMQKQMDRFFDDLVASWSTAQPTMWQGVATEFVAPCDVDESENHFVMSFDLPGVKKEDVKVTCQDNILTVTGERRDENEQKSKNRYRAERYFGSFVRSFTLPSGVKADQIQAEYKDGVLHIAVPKSTDSKTLQIRIGEGKSGFFERVLSHKKEDVKVAS